MNIDNFITPLGTVELKIDFEGNVITTVMEKPSKKIYTPDWQIEIITVDDFSSWQEYVKYKIEQFRGWLILATKKTDAAQNTEITCQLKTDDPDLIYGPCGDENVDFIEIKDRTHFLSIGTEDGESLKWRAKYGDYMPTRFEKELGYWSEKYSFTSNLDLGFKTIIPHLNKDEKIYFHYLIAANSKPTDKSDDVMESTTSTAVYFTKSELFEKLNLK